VGPSLGIAPSRSGDQPAERNARAPAKDHQGKHAMRPALRWLTWPWQALALALFWSCCALVGSERAATFGARLGCAVGPRHHRQRRLRANLAIPLAHATDEQVEAYARRVWGSFGPRLRNPRTS
jgi:lauroyl/myristoyl acyltransferase